MMKKVVGVILSVVMLGMMGCSSPKEDVYGEKEMIMPFWNSNKMYAESVMMVKEPGSQLADGSLAFVPIGAIKVQDYSLGITYQEGVDYKVEGRKITRLEESKMPFLDEEQLYGINLPADSGLITQPCSPSGIAKGYQNVSYGESPFLFKTQVFVTYQYDNATYTGYKPTFKGDKLPQTMAKLNGKQNLSVVVYGDSISTGCNASGGELVNYYDEPNDRYTPFNLAPFTPSWPELVVQGLKADYSTEIQLLSASKGGITSDWGKRNALSRAYKPEFGYDPDLIIMGFGINDSTGGMSVETYKQNNKQIIESIRGASTKEVEFLLVGTMLCNPDAIQYGVGTEGYMQALDELCAELPGVTCVDVGAMHKELLKNKRYIDMNANGINHPNDFMIRVYAMNVYSLLAKQG